MAHHSIKDSLIILFINMKSMSDSAVLNHSLEWKGNIIYGIILSILCPDSTMGSGITDNVEDASLTSALTSLCTLVPGTWLEAVASAQLSTMNTIHNHSAKTWLQRWGRWGSIAHALHWQFGWTLIYLQTCKISRRVDITERSISKQIKTHTNPKVHISTSISK